MEQQWLGPCSSLYNFQSAHLPAQECFLLLILLFTTTAVSGTGKVDVVDELTTLHQNQFTGSIRLSFSEVVIDNAVNVSCSQHQSGASKANLRFGYAIFPIGSNTVNMSVSIISAGDSVPVSCFGYSLNNGNQFFVKNSTGKLGNIVVRRAPSVSICSGYVYVKGYTQSVQSFTVQLSEPAVTTVVINCSVSGQFSNSPNSLKLTFLQATVLQQQTTATVGFRVQSPGQPVKVVCRAQSQKCLTAQSQIVISTTVVPLTSINAASSTPSPAVASISSGFSGVSENRTTALLATTHSYNALTPSAAPSITPDASSNSSVPHTSLQPSGNASSSSMNASSASEISSLSSLSIASSISERSSSIFSSFLSPISSLSNSAHLSHLPSSSTVPLPRPTTSPPLPENVCQYLFNTSQASPANFVVKQPSITAHPSYMDYSNLGDHVSYVVLDEALEGTSNLVLQCRIQQITITDIGQAVCSSNGLPIGGSPVLALADITIRLLESQITFKPGTILGNITVQITSFGNQTFSQLFHAFCCAPSSNAKYRGQTVSVFLWIDGKGILPFDWKQTPEQQQRKMTPVESLDFTCPCNLNENYCDLNCCCDKDCSSNEISRFSCIDGAFGGRELNSFEFDCNAVWPDRTDWSPILCVVTNNSPFLGLFFKYTTPAIVTTSNEFQSLAVSRVTYSFEENEARSVSDGATSGYTYGLPVKTNFGLLTLPSLIGDNSCAFKSVRYLVDKKSSCLEKVSREICTKDTFNSLNFILSDKLMFPSCTVPGILDGRTSTSLAPKIIEYYCLSSSSNYVFSVANPVIAEESKESLFSSQGSGGALVSSRCSFDNGVTRPPQPFVDNATDTCQNAVLDINYVISWTAKEIKDVTAKITLGSIPLNTATRSTITYTYYTTRVITSSFIIPSSVSNLTPIHSASQVIPSHFPSISDSHTISIPALLTPSATLPVVTGISASSSLLGSTVPSRPSISSVSSLSRSSISTSVSNSSDSGLNTTVLPTHATLSASYNASSIIPATPELITLTVKTSTVIVQNMTIQHSVLQKFTVAFSYAKSVNVNSSVSSVLNASTPTVAFRSGNPGYVNGKPLITRMNATGNISMTNGLQLWKSTGDGLCSSAGMIPVSFGKNSLSGCSVRIGLDAFANCSQLAATIKKNQDKLIQGIQIARRGNPSVSTTDDWLDIVKIEATSAVKSLIRSGVCFDIPAHLVIEVLISEAGMRYGEPQMEISGLKMRYITETWSLRCSSGANSACYNNTDASSRFTTPFLKSFYLTSSVVFVRIPSVDPPRVKRSAVTVGLCKYDSCLKELFYPIINAYSSNIAEFNLRFTQDATAVAMTIVFIAFGALYVSGPWRS